MIDLQLICTYCDNIWQERVYSHHSFDNKTCSTCSDKNIKVVKLEDVMVNYYVGCPPFPEKKKEEKEKPVNDYPSWGFHGHYSD